MTQTEQHLVFLRLFFDILYVCGAPKSCGRVAMAILSTHWNAPKKLGQVLLMIYMHSAWIISSMPNPTKSI